MFSRPQEGNLLSCLLSFLLSQYKLCKKGTENHVIHQFHNFPMQTSLRGNSVIVYLTENSKENTPVSYIQAINSEDSTFWNKAIEKEILKMYDHDVWIIIFSRSCGLKEDLGMDSSEEEGLMEKISDLIIYFIHEEQCHATNPMFKDEGRYLRFVSKITNSSLRKRFEDVTNREMAICKVESTSSKMEMRVKRGLKHRRSDELIHSNFLGFDKLMRDYAVSEHRWKGLLSKCVIAFGSRNMFGQIVPVFEADFGSKLSPIFDVSKGGIDRHVTGTGNRGQEQHWGQEQEIEVGRYGREMMDEKEKAWSALRKISLIFLLDQSKTMHEGLPAV
ncbi:putative signal peptide protein [Puccinia sorghi]|uniref:Putative signal peptide protein n=1 Tax=Puccinia sorghi TaxID=27349 RepID=A0A0L6U8P9_9BASI|nr:putative signal peptide protein [Puccinia sorghi]